MQDTRYYDVKSKVSSLCCTDFTTNLSPIYMWLFCTITQTDAFNCSTVIILMIERPGKHLNIPISERLCITLCSTAQIENEEHFLLHCACFEDNRKTLIENITKIIPYFINTSSISKLSILLDNKNPKIMRMSSAYIQDCFRIRDALK